MTEPVLEARNLSLSFGAIKALDDVNFSLYGNELLSIIGPNGAGKSSLLNCLCGFYQPHQGSVRFMGEDVTLN
jgi:branched-chain amino acid transport system ATP-binding protein